MIDETAFRLDQKICVVTGSAQGLGAAFTNSLRAVGALVNGCDRLEGFEERTGPDGVDRRFDVRDSEALGAFLEAVVAQFGRIDVLVNNAGGTFYSEMTNQSTNARAALVAENFTHVTEAIARSVDAMEPGSTIINITSIEGHRAGPGYAVYSAMKSALANLTQSLALELAPRGIRVNAIAPDVLMSEGIAQISGGAARVSEYQAAPVPPLGHRGAPDDACGALLFLASSASSFVTGTTIHVDGGNLAAGGWHRVMP